MTLPHGAVGWSAVCECGIFLIILTYFLASKSPQVAMIAVQSKVVVLLLLLGVCLCCPQCLLGFCLDIVLYCSSECLF